MEGLEFAKGDVVSALEAQLKTHKAIVDEAWEGYKVAVVSQLKEALEDIEAGDRAAVQVYVKAPEDYTDDIETAIQMLQMTTASTVVLGEQEFGCYIQGRWNWANSFLANNSAYSVTAMSSI